MTVNEPLVEELHKRVIKKFKRRKVYARLTGYITIADLAEMESLCPEDKMLNIYCSIDVFQQICVG